MELEKLAASLRRWLKYFVGSNLYGLDPDPEVVEQLRSLGEIVAEVHGRRPDRFPDAGQPGSDPIEILRQALQPQFSPDDLIYPDDDVSILFSGLDTVADDLLAQQHDTSEAPDRGSEEFAPKDDIPKEQQKNGEPKKKKDGDDPQDVGGKDDEWTISLYLRKIHCKKETSPEVLTDDFRLYGHYKYGAEGGPLQEVKGQFDTNTQKTYAGDGLLLASEKIPATTEFTIFDTTIVAFEDDGMTAANARILAFLMGNLVTLGVNGLMAQAQVAGINVPAQAKEAYDNLGLPGLIGWLAKAWGPEPFIPQKAYAKTKWPPDTPATPPDWVAKIPEPGGSRRTHSGAETHDGSVTMNEATVEPAAAGGSDLVLVVVTDGGQYYVYLRYKVELK